MKKSPYLLLLCLCIAFSASGDAQTPRGAEAGAAPADAAVSEQSLSLGGVELSSGPPVRNPVRRNRSWCSRMALDLSDSVAICHPGTRQRRISCRRAKARRFECADVDASLPDPTALKPALMWSDRDYRDRADDVRNVVAALKTDARFRERADMTHLALAGHSLGGYTVLGLGGAWPTWTLSGVKAILALSPYSTPFRAKQGLRKLHAPVMYQGGTLDLVFTPPLRMTGGAFDLSPPRNIMSKSRAPRILHGPTRVP